MSNIRFLLLLFFPGVFGLTGTLSVTAQAPIQRGVIFDYLGAEGKPIDINSIPVHDNVDFYFLLSFAIDRNADGFIQNGVFSPYWADSLTPESIAELKSERPNVKMMMSLTGWSIYTNEGKDLVIWWYDPEDEETWLNNAVSSITDLVETYHLDGIDIDYEKILEDSRFAPLVGQLVTTLKDSGVITVATMAPYTATDRHYATLFTNYSSVFDYVMYQFYSEPATRPEEMLARYNVLAKTYTYEKLVPGYDVNGPGLQGANFTTALELIQEDGHPLVGVMIYSADEGLTNSFYYEEAFQALFP